MSPLHSGGGGGGSVSGFAAAAKVLFDSAKKVGAVEPIGVTSKLYAQQLKKIQSQSRKKGGSLGSVSYKVAEFLSTQRTPKVNVIRSSTSIAKRVPLIDIPLQQPKKKGSSTEDKPQVKKVPTLDFIYKKGGDQDVKLGTIKKETPLKNTKTSSVESLLSEQAVPSLDFITDSKKTKPLQTPSKPVASLAKEEEEKKEVFLNETTTPLEVTKVTISEDKPLFESTVSIKPMMRDTIDHTVAALFEKSERKPHTPIKPSITVPISSEIASSSSPSAAPIAPIQDETISVDVWELQREREIEQLRKSQENAEKERLALQREEEYKTLGDEWVKRRTSTSPICEKDPKTGILEKMYLSTQWETCFQYFNQLVSTSTPSSVVSKQAVRIMEKRLKYVPLSHRETIKSALLKELKDRRLNNELSKFELRHENGETFLNKFRSASDTVKDSLDIFTVSKAVNALVSNGAWEEAIQLVENSKQRFNDKNGLLESKLLTTSRNLDPEAVIMVTDYVLKTLTASDRLGKTHKLELARLEKGPRRRQMISQLVSSSDVDEVVYAELLRITPKENVKDVLEDIRKRGLNVEDPVILSELCWKSIDAENPQLLFKEVERQEAMIGLRGAHLLAAVAVSRASRSEDALRSTVHLLKKGPVFKAKFILRKMLPILHEKKMTKEIVELADFYAQSLPIATALPYAVAFINHAFKAVGREPLSDQIVGSLPKRELKSTKHSDSNASNVQKTPGISVSSEELLQCAKEKHWEKALTLINSIPFGGEKGCDTETLTLMYNCALSASVEKVDIVKSLYDKMKENGVQINATTNNAVLSSLMRSPEWEEAVKFYKEMDPSLRDNNTYAVMLSLFGKTDKWEEALEVVKTARADSTKTPVIIYTLGINAVYNHCWSSTLELFQACRKEHGIQNIKENVIDKVIRCLSQNKRTVELQKLEMELAKAKKKKKQ
ncbi:Pentatricopeptide repeat [Trypanosoma melophagium]|uniref:Pentatricopeptide repeat n=1 Tax=Trypanosoma melophagium TaxID=715481 RepID=UPI003519EAF2|nr:Pentatricopeptide repeat [Trypanosoma melophagium]